MKLSGLARGLPPPVLLAVFRGRQIDHVSLVVDGHGLGAGPRFEILDDLEFPGRRLARDVQNALAATREDRAALEGAVECGRVATGADRQVGQHVAIFGVEHHQLLRLAAADEQVVILGVDRQTDRCPARRDRPFVDDLAGFGVNHGDLILVLQVDVDFASGRRWRGIRACRRGRSTGSALPLVGIDVDRNRNEAPGGAASNVNLLVALSLMMPSAPRSTLTFPKHGVGLRVEDHHETGTVRDETASGLAVERHAVIPLLTLNVGDHLASW